MTNSQDSTPSSKQQPELDTGIPKTERESIPGDVMRKIEASLGKGDSLAFVSSKPDGTTDLTVFGLEPSQEGGVILVERVYDLGPTKETRPISKRVIAEFGDAEPVEKSEFSLIQVQSLENSIPSLSPKYLATYVAPYLTAIADLQHTLEVIKQKQPSTVLVKTITQMSPISVSLEGAADAVGTIREIVTPWRRQHLRTLATIEEQEGLIRIEMRKAETLEKRAVAQKQRAEADKIQAEADKIRAESQKLALENEKLRAEIQTANINMAIEIIAKLAPDLAQTEKISYLLQLMDPLKVFAESPLEMNDT